MMDYELTRGTTSSHSREAYDEGSDDEDGDGGAPRVGCAHQQLIFTMNNDNFMLLSYSVTALLSSFQNS